MMKNKILIFGKGFMGARLQEELGGFICSQQIDSYETALSQIEKYKPQIVINCIGSTGKSNVDDCEKDIDNTLCANVFVPLWLAEACLRKKIRLVHISSGCIYRYNYAKDKPIKEEKAPDFFDLFYSRTKIYSERALERIALNYGILIPRIRIPLDDRPHAKNILTKLINYKNVIDLPNSVTYLPDFIRALKFLIQKKATGVYNVVNKGALRYPKLMDTYRKFCPDFKYKVIPYKSLRLVRTNLILSTEKLENSGFTVRNINEVLEECVRNYLKY